MAELTISSDEIRSAIANYTSSYSPEASREEVGVVISAADGIAQVSGMPSVMTNELLEFPGGVIGVAQNLDTDKVGVVVLGNFESLAEGDEVVSMAIIRHFEASPEERAAYLKMRRAVAGAPEEEVEPEEGEDPIKLTIIQPQKVPAAVGGGSEAEASEEGPDVPALDDAPQPAADDE